MMDPYVLDTVSEDEDAYEAAKARHKKRLKDILAATAMIHALTGEDAMRLALDEDALYNEDNYDDWEDEIYND